MHPLEGLLGNHLLRPNTTDKACATERFDIDVKKMPLGNLSKTQVQKGYDVLAELKTAIAARNSQSVATLTSRFYTVIPHNFGRQRPPLIDTAEKLQAKFASSLQHLEFDIVVDATVWPVLSCPCPFNLDSGTDLQVRNV